MLRFFRANFTCCQFFQLRQFLFKLFVVLHRQRHLLNIVRQKKCNYSLASVFVLRLLMLLPGLLLSFVSHSSNEFLCAKCLRNVKSEIGKDGFEMKIWRACGWFVKSKQMLTEAPEVESKRTRNWRNGWAEVRKWSWRGFEWVLFM